MLHLFHGENIELSRKELNLLKESFKDNDLININGKTMSVTDLYQATQSDSLFTNKKLIVIENYFGNAGKKKSAIAKNVWHIISQIQNHIEVVFWEDKKIPKTIINEFPKNTDIALFEIDRLLFAFLDSIRPNQASTLLYKLTAVLKNDPPELVFVMLVRQFRLLIMGKDLQKSIPDLSPWQISKILNQCQFFDMQKLMALYHQLLNIDIRQKTSSGAFDLTDELKLFLIKI